MLGVPLVAELERRGHDVRAVSRSSPAHRADVTTGEGIAEAVAGAGVVIHAQNGPPSKKASGAMVEGSRRLIAAAPAAHHVCVSIVGIERVPLAYYAVKLAQEAAVREHASAWTIVRATQFHPFATLAVRAAAKRHIRLRSSARLQPVDVADVARALADVAEQPPRRTIVDVVGPEVLTLSEIADRAVNGTAALPLPVPWPPRLGRALRAGALTSDDPDVRGTTTIAQWLSTQSS